MFAFVSAAYRNGRVVRDPDAILQSGKDTCLDVENNNRHRVLRVGNRRLGGGLRQFSG